MVRSRTGCLTCRKRKLKCDEEKPICGQCQRANRECEPSSGLTFRHQHNASMNADVNGLPSAYTLGSFYNYRKAFDNRAIWVDIPKGEHLFINTSNPYEDPPSPNGDGRAGQNHAAYNHPSPGQLQDALEFQELSPNTRSHGLEVLSEAAVFIPQQGGLARQQPTSNPDHSFHSPLDPTASSAAMTASNSPHGSVSVSGSGAINMSLDGMTNPVSAMESPIDPILTSPPDRQDVASSNTAGTSPALIQEAGMAVESSLDHKEAFLLRHFSELPGRWMDLFDFGCYFGSIVPVQARTDALLKHSICAYAAKQLFRASTQKAIVGGITSRQATMEIYDGPVDWEVEATIHYGKAVSLLQGLVVAAMDTSDAEGSDGFFDFLEPSEDIDMHETEHLRLQKKRAKEKLQEEEVVAASTILGIYEFVSATGPAWSRHLNGTKLLLDLAQQQGFPGTGLATLAMTTPQELPITEGRKAAFWQLARQDYLAAFINECRTRLDTEDLELWQRNGLSLNEDGLVVPSKAIDIQGMQECMFANALIWLSSKICNFIAAGETSDAVPPGDRSETIQFEKTPGKYAKSQAFLLEKWKRLSYELEFWFEGLPASFIPSARMRPREAIFEEHERLTELTDKARKFEEIWYAKSMCAGTMQHYHMARVLLLLNKPHESTARRTTLGRRFNSMRSISEECVYHCYQIIGISLSRPDSAARIHSTQPLFVAGHCLTNRTERQIIIDLLKGIEKDLGWATEHRVQQLQLEWDWTAEIHMNNTSKTNSTLSMTPSDLSDPLKWRF